MRKDNNHTLLKSFRLQQPQFREASIPIISIHRMLSGVPRALNLPAGCSVLEDLSNWEKVEVVELLRILQKISQKFVVEKSVLAAWKS
jgi:hypothetical protein